MHLRDLAELPAVVDTATAAAVLGVSLDLLYRLAREGDAPIQPLRLGRCLRWPTAALVRLVGAEAIVAAVEVDHE